MGSLKLVIVDGKRVWRKPDLLPEEERTLRYRQAMVATRGKRKLTNKERKALKRAASLKSNAAKTVQRIKRKQDTLNAIVPYAPGLPGALFYRTKEWRELRYKVLSKYGARCMVDGRTPVDGFKMHVDHIKPRSLFPELELVFENLQVLCEQCNIGKSNTDSTDWR